MIDEKTIVKKTYNLYLKYGIKSISVDEIALNLGISKKTLYTHIKSRDELLQLVVRYSLVKFSSELHKCIVPEDSVFEQLTHFFGFMIKSMRNINPSFLLDLHKSNYLHYQEIDEFRTQTLRDEVGNILMRGMDEKLFRNDIHIQYVYENLMFKVSENAYKAFSNYTVALSDDTIPRLILNDIAGITTIKGHREFEKKYEKLLQLLR